MANRLVEALLNAKKKAQEKLASLEKKPLVSPQPWNDAGKKIVTPVKPLSEKVHEAVWLSKPVQNLTNAGDILTNPKRTPERNLYLQGLQTPVQGRAPATQQAVNFMGNVISAQTGGVKSIREGVDAFKKKDYLSAAVKPVFGAGKIVSSALPTTLASNVIASSTRPTNKLDLPRRLAAGYLSGVSNEPMAANVPSQNIKVFGQEFDPAKTAGSMVGFTQNPVYKGLFGQTAKLNSLSPTTSKAANFLLTRGVKGGVEGAIQAVAETPTDATPEQKAKSLVQNVIFGVGSEVGTDAAGKAFKKLWDNLPIKSKIQLGNAVKKVAAQEGRLKVGSNQYQKRFADRSIASGSFQPISTGKLVRDANGNYVAEDRIVKDFVDKLGFQTQPKGGTKAIFDAESIKNKELLDDYYKQSATGIMGGKVAKSVDQNSRSLEQGISPKPVETSPQTKTLLSTTSSADSTSPDEVLPEDLIGLPQFRELPKRVQQEALARYRSVNPPTRVPQDTTAGNLTSAVAKQAPTPQTQPQVSNKVLPTSTPIIAKAPTRQEVAATLPQKVDSLINKTLGYSTQAPTGGTKKASYYTEGLRIGQEKVTAKVEAALGSQNKAVRTAAATLQGFFKGLGTTPERANASMELRGGMAVANERAYNVMDALYKTLGHNKQSLEKINAVLDPEIAKVKVSFDQLTPTEKQVYGLIREGFDLVHDTSYSNGHISPELYTKNRGKYTPRLYEVTELPQEINSLMTQGKKIANDLYKSRKTLDEWKMDNSLNDPVYGLGKRLAQVETNTAIKKYTDYLASNPRYVSDVERAGFTRLSDSPAYGSLAGKYVLNSAAEELKGHFYSNQAMQNLYDVFRAYDRMGVRQLQKKLLTVFNPTTNVGNIVSDQVFGFLTGVDPFTLNKNVLKMKQNPKEFKQLSDYLMRSGIVGTDITRTDFVNKLASMNDLANGKKENVVSMLAKKAQSFYGGTDDVYKVAAFRSLLDKGFTLEEATRKVADGFQNYANVGKFYDLAAKTPIIGKPFIKFQGDLIRIIKNGAVNNPLGLITFLGTLWGTARLFSKASGESDADREYRENRWGAPMIPGLNIPLTWQTPIGEINVARYVSPFFANNEITNIGSNMLPFVPNIDAKKDVASNITLNVNDPFVSPLVNLAVNRDFRGKPIADPDQTKYKPSTLTPDEQRVNQAIFGGRAYAPPLVNSAIDVGSALMGKKNMYGAQQTPLQAVSRMAGVKIQKYGPEQIAEAKARDLEFEGYANDDIDTQVSRVYKQQLKGEITEEVANKRIQYIESKRPNGAGKGVVQSKSELKVRAYESLITEKKDEIKSGTADFTKGDVLTSAEAAHRYLIKLPKEKRPAAYKQLVGKLSPEIKQEMIAIGKLEAQGLSGEDRLMLTVPEEVRARLVHERIMRLTSNNRAKKYQQLVAAGVVTQSMKSVLLKLIKNGG